MALETWFDDWTDTYDNFINMGKILVPAAPFLIADIQAYEMLADEIRKAAIRLRENKSVEIKKEWMERNTVIKIMKNINVFEE